MKLPMHLVNPLAGQIGERAKVFQPAQPLRLEAAHLAGRGGRAGDCPVADHPAHRRVAAQPLGVIHVLVAGQPPEHRLTQQAGQPVATVLAGARFRQCIGTRVGQAQRVVQLAVSQQPGVGGDRGAAKFQPQTPPQARSKSRLHPGECGLISSATRRVPRWPRVQLCAPASTSGSRYARLGRSKHWRIGGSTDRDGTISTFGSRIFFRHARESGCPGGQFHARSPGPRFPHETCPWAEGARGDDEEKPGTICLVHTPRGYHLTDRIHPSVMLTRASIHSKNGSRPSPGRQERRRLFCSY